MLHINRRGHGIGYVGRFIVGDKVNLPMYGRSIVDLVSKAYRYDRRAITRAELNRIASEYRARCAEEDAQ